MSVIEQDVPIGYKTTELGVIPEDWDVLPLQRLTVLMTNGFVGTAKAHYTERDDGVTYIQGYNILENNFNFKGIKKVTKEFHQRQSKSNLRTGDMLMVQTGDVGLTTTVTQDLAGSNCHALIISRFKTKHFNSLYFSYYLNSQQGRLRLKDIEVGTTMKHINVGDLLHFEVPVPCTIREQTAIANALSDVDELLTELEKLISKKQAIKTATMQQLLTGKTRLPQFVTYTEGEKQGQPKGTKPSELGEIPEDWDVRPIESVIKDLRGGAPFKPSDFTNFGVKVLPKGGVVRGGVLRVHEKDQQFCSKNWSLKYSKNCVDNRYTIVVLRDLVPSGPSIGLMVNIPTAEKYVLAQGVYGFIAEDEETSKYLIHYSNTTQYRKAANEIMVGSTQVHITNGAFKALIVPFPPKEERGAIATILSDMDNEIQTLEQRLAKTRQIKQGMMQELLTGRTRLPFNKDKEA